MCLERVFKRWALLRAHEKQRETEECKNPASSGEIIEVGCCSFLRFVSPAWMCRMPRCQAPMLTRALVVSWSWLLHGDPAKATCAAFGDR